MLLRQSGSLLVATLVINACSFLLNLYVGRTLGPTQYGTLGALLSLFYLLVIPAGAVQTGAMRFASVSRATTDRLQLAGLLQRLLRFLLIVALVAVGPVLLGAQRLSQFLAIDSVWPIIGLAIMLGLTLLLSVNRGALQGWQRFGLVSFNMSLEAVARLVFALAFVALGYGFTGVIFGYGLATLISFLATWFNLPRPQMMSGGPALREILSFSVPVLLTYIAFAWLTNIDVLIVKHFLEAQIVGYYVALATLAKLLFFISTALTEAMFSQLVDGHTSLGRKNILYQTIGVDVLLCGVAIVGAALLAEPVMTKIFGSAFAPASTQLWRFCLASALFTLVVIYSKSFLARAMVAFVPVLIGMSILQPLLLIAYHDSIQQLLNVLIVCYGMTVLLLIGLDLLSKRRGRP